MTFYFPPPTLHHDITASPGSEEAGQVVGRLAGCDVEGESGETQNGELVHSAAASVRGERRTNEMGPESRTQIVKKGRGEADLGPSSRPPAAAVSYLSTLCHILLRPPFPPVPIPHEKMAGEQRAVTAAVLRPRDRVWFQYGPLPRD